MTLCHQPLLGLEIGDTSDDFPELRLAAIQRIRVKALPPDAALATLEFFKNASHATVCTFLDQRRVGLA